MKGTVPGEEMDWPRVHEGSSLHVRDGVRFGEDGITCSAAGPVSQG